jgi:hypothetical protein
VVAVGRGNTQQKVQELVRYYSPIVLQIYSPDLAPQDFHLFGPLKQHFGGHRLHSSEEVEMAVSE